MSRDTGHGPGPSSATPASAHDQTTKCSTSYSTMAFFMLSTSKIILMSSCTGLGSLDLVPGFTVSFFTASSSFREKRVSVRDPVKQSKVVLVVGVRAAGKRHRPACRRAERQSARLG